MFNHLRLEARGGLFLVAALVVAFLFISIPFAQAATLNVSFDSTNVSYYTAIVKAADRLVALQNSNGSWDWVVTGATGPTASTYLNITGVTAEGLLSAYTITGNQSYLDAAKKAGDFIVLTIDGQTTKSINAYNVLFLKKLADASGITTYADKATEYFGMLYSTTPATICATGCVDSAGIIAGQKANRSWAGNPNGVVLWDLVPYVEYAKLVGDNTHAQELADAIIAEANLETYVNTVTNYDLGLASALKAAALVGDTANVTSLSSKITSSDASFGTVADGKVQTTSYMARAFKLTSDSRLNDSVAYLVSGAMSTGGWVETDGSEYSEVDSEAATALSVMLPQSVQYYSIQDAVNAATSGDTINVAAGTYSETGQILIDKDLTITGDSASKPVIKPTANRAGINASDAWFLVSPSVTFNLSNVVLDGDTFFVWQGVRSHGTAVIDNVDFRNIQGSLTGSPYRGFAVLAFGGTVPGGAGSDSHSSGGTSSTLTVANSTFEQIGRVGILVKGTESTATVTGSTYTGKGDGDFLDYAFEAGAGGSITANGNTISSNRGVASDGSTSAGILVTDYYGTGTSATLEGNTITNNTDGVAVGYNATDVSIASVHNNNLSGNTGNGVNSTNPSVDASSNWWGDASGPVHASNPTGTGVVVSDNVTFSPWYSNAAMTTFKSIVTTTGEGEEATNSTTIPSAVTQSGTSESVSVVSEIPAGTVITGDSSWDGTILPPTATTITLEIPSFDVAVTSAIAIGSSDSDLIFDKAVKLTFAGQAGKRVGWYNSAGAFTEITDTCSLNDQATGDALVEGTSCKIDAAADLVVWTKHFTTFVTYTQTAIVVTPPSTSGGGGGGGGIVGPGFGLVESAIPAVAVAQIAQAATPAPAQGEVLGAATYRFGLALAIGSTGDEVTELQKRLADEGVYSGPVTGYFGSLTSQAVKLFQAKYGISQVGVVGPQTRSKLNATSAVAVPGCEGGNKFNTETGKPCVSATAASSGQAFGAAVSAFARSLAQGSRGDDVTALQNRLTAEGVYTGPVTGYFGPLTAQAVKEFQAKYGIEQAGVVGPKTMAELNK